MRNNILLSMVTRIGHIKQIDVGYDLSDDLPDKFYIHTEEESPVIKTCEVKRLGENYTRNAGEEDVLSRGKGQMIYF